MCSPTNTVFRLPISPAGELLLPTLLCKLSYFLFVRAFVAEKCDKIISLEDGVGISLRSTFLVTGSVHAKDDTIASM